MPETFAERLAIFQRPFIVSLGEEELRVLAFAFYLFPFISSPGPFRVLL